MAIHVAHPKCAECERALYKAMEKGAKVRPEDPYAYCRNAACGQYGYRDSAPEPEPEVSPEEPAEAPEEPEPANEVPAAAPPPPPAALPGIRRRLRSRPAEETPPPPPPSVEVSEAPTLKDMIVEPEGEPIAVHMARERIRTLLSQVTHGRTPAAIGLTLAIANQELGCHAGANALIDEFDLGRFGLQKFTADGEPEEAAAE